KNNPLKKVKYISSERFTSELIDALSKKGMDSFKSKYHKIDTLIIDDIQFIAGKEKTQEEFFHTFNALYQKNKQIIITSDRLPKAISTLEERLRSRFEGGMIADISYPDLETRIAILQSKIKEKKINIPEDVLSYIASNISKNIREIEGALNRIIAYSQMNNTIPNIKTATKILSQIVNFPKKMTNYKNILKTVSEFYDITIEDLINRSRKKELVRPRQITMYLIRKELNSSYPFIGEKLGGRDHTTVMYACQKVEKDIKDNESTSEELNFIKERLYN
ncbi:chromosomal replication initiator protein DnaA, partial [Patescibacteria group bacterium]|nr:chromosomal replication initiator protein DnaA [Patescibacteria group bacterium]